MFGEGGAGCSSSHPPPNHFIFEQYHDRDRDHHHDRHLSLKDGALVGVCLPQNTFHLWSLSSLPNAQDFFNFSKSDADEAHLPHATVFHHRQRPTSRRILKAGQEF